MSGQIFSFSVWLIVILKIKIIKLNETFKVQTVLHSISEFGRIFKWFSCLSLYIGLKKEKLGFPTPYLISSKEEKLAIQISKLIRFLLAIILD